MTPERRAEIERLYRRASERPAADRARFLIEACGADLALRSELDARLAQSAPSENAPIGGPPPAAASEAGRLSLTGRRIGVYLLQTLAGAGGMGEVYRARDTRLDRQVAIKVLPQAFTSDPDRRARFEREARVMATLNHPNIGAIYGFEESDGVHALILEFVDGPTLADRIAQGALSLVEALPIARQIAEALEAAHEQGVIHRDLKPANVKVRGDGTVKVLDFGLAKALDPVGPPSGSPMDSPTLSAIATRAGIVLGTVAYMAPEQAKGKAVDRRADIWAFGAVLFEMLTGRPLYTGETSTETLARVIEREPDLSALPETTPRAIRALIARCLTKDLRARLQAVGEARIVIERASAQPEAATAEGFDGPSARTGRAPSLWRTAPWVIAAVAGTAFAVTLILWAPWRKAPDRPSVRLSAQLGADVSLAPGAALALSPDGSMLAFAGDRAGTTQLYLRRLGELQATAFSGTAGARDPFFAPDGQWVGFFADGKLKKIAVTGSEAVTLCDAPAPSGGSWGDDGRIVFAVAPSRASHEGLQQVSAAGGSPQSFTTLGEGESAHQWPQVMSGSGAVVYTVLGEGGSARASITNFEDANVVVQPLPAGAPRILVRGGYHGRSLPNGHLVYLHEGTLFSVPFDLDRLETTGRPVPAFAGLSARPGSGSAQYAVSAGGLLVYLPEPSTSSDAPIVWMDKAGRTTPLMPTPSNWSNPHFSPDGTKLAIDIFDERQGDLWIYEWTRDLLTRVTSDPSNESLPVWTPDGRRITFASTRGDKTTLNLYWRRADGSGEAERLTNSRNPQLPGAWEPTGKYLVFQENVPQTGLDLFILAMEGDEATGWKPGKSTVFLSTPFLESAPTFSPDGKWIAYHSNEAGEAGTDVYVRPFPGPGGKWRISTGGGASPMWSSVRRELFFRNQANQIMFVSYSVVGDIFKADKPRVWAEQPVQLRPRQRPFDLHPDGERFAVSIPPVSQSAAKQDRVVFILNFFDELQRVGSR